MIRLLLCFVIQPNARQGQGHWFLAGLTSLLCVCLSPVQAKVSLQSLALPQTVMRSVIIDQSTWQGMGVELEHLHSEATPEVILEQLALLLPELTPVWFEQDVVRAHWTTTNASYALFLWATENQATEGLLSVVALGSREGQIKATPPVAARALDWLPQQAAPLFSFTDSASGLPAVLSGFAVPLMSSQVIDHLKRYGQRHGWLRLQDDLTFVRDAKRLSFLVSPAQGNTTVFILETSRDAP
jgi:hypothetical protein